MYKVCMVGLRTMYSSAQPGCVGRDDGEKWD